MEHWRDGGPEKEESHMMELQAESHGGEETPMFHFNVVKKCKSSLERE